jgi:HK97 family phage prohead protease
MKNTNVYQTKGSIEIKDMDVEKRQVAIYLSKFDVIDSDMDLIRKGAFAKSIQEHGPDSTSNRKIQFLRFHDWTKPIGKFLELAEDDNGLFAVAQLGQSTLGEDAWNDYADGIIREHSIGFQYMSDKMKYIEDETKTNGGYWLISEVKLWEGSAVTFGANEYTNVVDVMKSGNKVDFVQKISNEIDTLVKSLVTGKGTDERLFDIEMRIKFLNSQLVSLAEHNPTDVKGQLVESKTETPQFDWSDVIQKIKV